MIIDHCIVEIILVLKNYSLIIFFTDITELGQGIQSEERRSARSINKTSSDY